jgi:hypothetical protein
LKLQRQKTPHKHEHTSTTRHAMHTLSYGVTWSPHVSTETQDLRDKAIQQLHIYATNPQLSDLLVTSKVTTTQSLTKALRPTASQQPATESKKCVQVTFHLQILDNACTAGNKNGEQHEQYFL